MACVDLSSEISTDIVETVKVIDFLIDRLPDCTESKEVQVGTRLVLPLTHYLKISRLKELEIENEAAGAELGIAIKESEAVLARLNSITKGIVEHQIAAIL
jgi:hypothetical protein